MLGNSRVTAEAGLLRESLRRRRFLAEQTAASKVRARIGLAERTPQSGGAFVSGRAVLSASGPKPGEHRQGF
jgi:hypothetical protein